MIETNNKLASGSYDNTIKIWNIENEECIRTLAGHTSYVVSVELIPPNRLVENVPFIVLIFPTLFVTTNLVPVLINVIDPVPPPKANASGQVLACIRPVLLVKINVFVCFFGKKYVFVCFLQKKL